MFASLAFRGYEEECYSEPLMNSTSAGGEQSVVEMEGLSKTQLLWRTVKDRVTLLGALFIFAYQGAEVYVQGIDSKICILNFDKINFWVDDFVPYHVP